MLQGNQKHSLTCADVDSIAHNRIKLENLPPENQQYCEWITADS